MDSDPAHTSPDDARTMKLLNLYAAAVPPFNGPDREHLRVRPQFMRDLLDYIGRCNDELAACRSEANGRLVDNLRVSPWCSEGEHHICTGCICGCHKVITVEEAVAAPAPLCNCGAAMQPVPIPHAINCAVTVANAALDFHQFASRGVQR